MARKNSNAAPKASIKKTPSLQSDAAKSNPVSAGGSSPASSPQKRPAKAFEFHVITPEEQTEDGTLLLALTIPGRPATKKTHQRVVRRGRHTRILPSEQYERYEKHCKPFCEAVWRDLGKPPMDFGVSVTLRIHVDNWVMGDETGYQQALGDLIEAHGIIANDLWIHWADDGVHMMQEPDKANPRAEIEIRRFRHPKETFRAQQEEAERKKQERLAQKNAKENNKT